MPVGSKDQDIKFTKRGKTIICTGDLVASIEMIAVIWGFVCLFVWQYWGLNSGFCTW
jgi:hypothetical protein